MVRTTLGFLVFLLLAVNSWAACGDPGDPCVQCTSAEDHNGPDGDVPASFGTLPTVGHHIVVWTIFESNSGETWSGTDDNQGNTYVTDRTSTGTDSGFSVGVRIHSTKVATSSGTFTVSDHSTGETNSTYQGLIACEFTTFAAASWADQGAATTSTSDPAVITAGGANSQADEVVIAGSYAYQGAPSGYTVAGTLASAGLGAVYKKVTAVETSAASFPNAATPQILIMALNTYKITGGGTTTPHGCLALLGVGGC